MLSVPMSQSRPDGAVPVCDEAARKRDTQSGWTQPSSCVSASADFDRESTAGEGRVRGGDEDRLEKEKEAAGARDDGRGL